MSEYKTLKCIGREIGRELRKKDIPEELFSKGVLIGRYVRFSTEVEEEIKSYLAIPAVKKQEMTNMRKYGVKSTAQVKEVKEKQKRTCLERYGATIPAKSKIIAEKMSKSMLKKNIEERGTIEERCKLYHDDIVVCSEFKGEKEDILFYCNNCGRFYNRAARYIEKSCPFCATFNKTDKELFFLKAKIIHGDKYDYSLVDYKNNHTKVKIFCKECKTYFYQSPNDHLDGHGHCISSRQEENVAKFLRENNIDFIPQKEFNECRGKKRKLPFDFYLPDYDLLIEIQGEQHYKDKWGRLIERQKLDKIKREYAQKSHKFIEIKYNEDEIEVLKNIIRSF